MQRLQQDASGTSAALPQRPVLRVSVLLYLQQDDLLPEGERNLTPQPARPAQPLYRVKYAIVPGTKEGEADAQKVTLHTHVMYLPAHMTQSLVHSRVVLLEAREWHFSDPKARQEPGGKK